jgi:S-adenosylmethionine-diacylglycerol 3-amino-3-carboxypropyl transferase
MFARNPYRHGMLGRFIGVTHALCRAYGVDLSELLYARTLEEQRAFSETALAPLFDKRAVRWVTANRGLAPGGELHVVDFGSGALAGLVPDRSATGSVSSLSRPVTNWRPN